MPKFNEFEGEWFGFECPICHVEDDGCEHLACCVNWHTGGVAGAFHDHAEVVREYLLQALERLRGLSNTGVLLESAPHLRTFIEELEEFSGMELARIPTEQLEEYLSDIPFVPYIASLFGSLDNSFPFRCRTDHWGPGNAFLLTGWHSKSPETLVDAALDAIEREIRSLPINIGPLTRPTDNATNADTSTYEDRTDTGVEDDPLTQILESVGYGTASFHSHVCTPIEDVAFLRRARPAFPLIQWGIFNPMGPTIEAIWAVPCPNRQVHLLYHQMFHPLSASDSVCAVIDASKNECDVKQRTIDLLCSLLSAQSPGHTPLMLCLPSYVALGDMAAGDSGRILPAIVDGLRQFTEGDFATEFDLLQQNPRPWDKARAELHAAAFGLAGEARESKGCRRGINAALNWWEAVTAPKHVNSYLSAILDACQQCSQQLLGLPYIEYQPLLACVRRFYNENKGSK